MFWFWLLLHGRCWTTVGSTDMFSGTSYVLKTGRHLHSSSISEEVWFRLLWMAGQHIQTPVTETSFAQWWMKEKWRSWFTFFNVFIQSVVELHVKLKGIEHLIWEQITEDFLKGRCQQDLLLKDQSILLSSHQSWDFSFRGNRVLTLGFRSLWFMAINFHDAFFFLSLHLTARRIFLAGAQPICKIL